MKQYVKKELRLVILLGVIMCFCAIQASAANYSAYQLRWYPFNNSWTDYWRNNALTPTGASVTNGYMEYDLSYAVDSDSNEDLLGLNWTVWVEGLGSKKTFQYNPQNGYSITIGSDPYKFIVLVDFNIQGNEIRSRYIQNPTYYHSHYAFSNWSSDFNYSAVYNGTGFKIYLNGVLVNQTDYGTPFYITSYCAQDDFRIGRHQFDCGNTADAREAGAIDNLMIWNTTLDTTSILNLQNCGNTDCALVITQINCTSCNYSRGDIESPYLTSSGTPNFEVTTNMNAYCRISDKNESYESMGADSNCTGGPGKTLSCTLPLEDSLDTMKQDFVYLGCIKYYASNESEIVMLEMEVTDASLQLQGDWNFNDGNASDYSGKGNDGTLNGNAVINFASGEFGQGLALDGTGDYMSVSDSSNLDFTERFTLTAWVNIRNYNTYGHIISKFDYGDDNESYKLIYEQTTGKLWCVISPDGTDTNGKVVVSPTAIGTYEFHHVACTYDSGNLTIFIDGIAVNSTQTGVESVFVSAKPLLIGSALNSGTPSLFFNGSIDEVRIWNTTLDSDAIMDIYTCGNLDCLHMSDFNCTSCDPPNGDVVSPYTTADTTPTFFLKTARNAWCRISDENIGYDSMGGAKDCNVTEGSNVTHICTLKIDDELVFSTDYVYIVCRDEDGVDSAVAKLQMNITDLVTNISNAMDIGIENSVVWPEGTIYTDQQVYLRDLSNKQVVGTVDRVVVYGNQRWLINYALENDTNLGLFNITPVVYSLDMVNMSLSEIEEAVTALIDSTKN